ncbi:MAG: LamG-like jellyroll fold domain-containing protein [Fibrobacterota bacterium]
MENKILFIIVGLFFSLLPASARFEDGFSTQASFSLSLTTEWDVLSGRVTLGAPFPRNPAPYPARDSTAAYLPTVVNGTEYPVAFPQRKGTVEFWVNGPFSDSAAYGNILDTWDASRNHIVMRSYGLYGKGAQLYFYDSTSKSYAWVVNFSPDSGAWNFMTVTWDMDSLKAWLYLNGRLLASGPVTKPGWLPAGQKLVFGTGYAGQLAEARVLSAVLSPDQVYEDYLSRYAVSGSILSRAVAPLSYSSWVSLDWSGITPPNTAIRLFIEQGDSLNGWHAVPDSILPGNNTGFTLSPVSLLPLAGRLPSIRLRAEFSTTDSLVTPVLDSWGVNWNTGLSHPRIYLTPEKIAFLKDRLDRNVAPYADFFSEIKKSASSNAGKVPPSRDSVLHLNDAQFRYLGNILPDMAMAYLFTDSVKYLNGVRRWMDSIIAYPNWADNRDLGPAHILYNMAIVYDWLYDKWDPAERTAIEAKLAVHADTLDTRWPGNRSWLQNHNYVCMGAVMTAGVALYDAVPGAEGWVRDAYANFSRVLPLLSPDGVGVEEIPYWGYGLEALLRYFALEESFLGEDRVSGSDWFRNTWNYRLHNSIPGFWYVTNFGDSPFYDWYGPGYMLQYLASKFDNPHAQWLSFKVAQERVDHRMGSHVDYRNLVWYDEAVDTQDVYSLPTRCLFDNMAQFASRSSWEDSNAIFFCTEAGPPMGYDAYTKINFDAGCGHQHPDKGHFILNGFNHFLVTDEGYTYMKRTAAHNIVTFDNGKGQLGGEVMWFNGNPYVGVANKPSFIHTDLSDRYEYLVADLTGAYLPELRITRYLRHFLFLDKKALLVLDEVESDTSRTMEWRLNVDTLASLTRAGRDLIMRTADRKAGFFLQDLSPVAPDSVYIGRFTQSDTFHADPEHGYPYDIVHYASTQQFQMMRRDIAAQFAALITPLDDSSIQEPSAVRTTNDTLVITLDDLIIRFHAASFDVRVQPPSDLEKNARSSPPFALAVSPNPFNPLARIRFSLPVSGEVTVAVFDVRGRCAAIPVSGVLKAGNHTVNFSGKGLASGLYFICLETSGRMLRVKQVLLR